MPKQTDYPRATLKNSLELARAVDGFGGKCSVEMAADALNKKVSGAFKALIGAAVKYKLITNKQGQLETTQLFRDHKLSYSDDEGAAILSEAFLSVPLFREICSRFEGQALPVNHFEKLLIREFGVPDQLGSRVAKYFLEGAKQCNLIGPNHTVRTGGISNFEEVEDSDEGDSHLGNERSGPSSPRAQHLTGGHTKLSGVDQPPITRSGDYSVRITGPGIDSVIAVHEEEDLLIVRAMLKKVEKKLLEREEPDDK